MKIRDLKIKLVEKKENSRLLAYAEFIIEDFRIREVRIIQGDTRKFVAMPSRKVDDQKYIDICHPINSKCRKELEELILNKYENVCKIEILKSKINLPNNMYFGVEENKETKEIKVVVFNENRTINNEYLLSDFTTETIEELSDEILSKCN